MVPDVVRPDSLGGVLAKEERVLTLLLAALAAMLQLSAAFKLYLAFATVLDVASSPWDEGRFLGLRAAGSRMLSEGGRRLAINLAVLLAVVSTANTFPALLGYAIEVAVLAAGTRSLSGFIDHVLPAKHGARRSWNAVLRRVERLWEAEEAPAPAPAPADPAGEEAP